MAMSASANNLLWIEETIFVIMSLLIKLFVEKCLNLYEKFSLAVDNLHK